MDALIIYDFDGVVADSEVLANAVLAEFVTELGVPTSLQDSYRLYMGKRFVDVIDAVAESLGRPVPETFASDYQTRTLARFRENLKLVEGVRRYIDTFEHVKVFLNVLLRIGIERAHATHVMPITAECPEREEFYEQVGDWWVRTHMSVDSMVGILTRLKDELGLSMEIRARDVLQDMLA